ncbi:MAG TPA: hypothetical protein VJ802_06885 [Gemmatimonadaceae bacterium]|nr:hypothetical protein [Gemmatimonadaceae bacterium]
MGNWTRTMMYGVIGETRIEVFAIGAVRSRSAAATVTVVLP